MKVKGIKRAVSLIVSVCMVMLLLPTTVLADIADSMSDAEQAAIEESTFVEPEDDGAEDAVESEVTPVEEDEAEPAAKQEAEQTSESKAKSEKPAAESKKKTSTSSLSRESKKTNAANEDSPREVTAATMDVKVTFGQNPEASVPDSVKVTSQYTIDGDNWITMQTKDVAISNKEGSVSFDLLPGDVTADGTAVTGYRVTQEAVDKWDTVLSDPVKGDDGNYTATVKNYKPISIKSKLAWSSADGDDVKDYSYADAEKTNLVFHPTDNDIKKATMNFSFTVDCTDDQSLAPGSITFTLPKSIFKDREGTYKAYDDSDVQIYTQVPEYPATSTTSCFSYKVEGDNYVFTNFDYVSNGTVSVSVMYRFRPTKVAGGTLESGTFGTETAVYGGDYFKTDVNVPISIDCNNDGTVDTEEKHALKTEVHTKVAGYSLSKSRPEDSNSGIYLSWQDSWGTKPADSNDYFYVIWTARSSRGGNPTQPYNVELTDNAKNLTIYSKTGNKTTWSGTYDGEQVGAISTLYSFDTHGVKNQIWAMSAVSAPAGYKNIAAEGWADEMSFRGYTNHEKTPTGGWNSDSPTTLINPVSAPSHTVYVLMRYPMKAIDDAKAAGVDMVVDGITVSNKVNYKLTGDDNYIIQNVSNTATATIKLEPYGGGGTFNKQFTVTNSQNGNRLGGVELLNGQSAMMKGIVGSNESYRLSADVKAPNTPADKEKGSTGKDNKYTYVLEDGNEVYASTFVSWNDAKTLSNLVDPVRLSADNGDFEFTSLYISLTEYDGTYNGAWTVNANASAEYGRMDPVIISVRKAGGEYYDYAKITKYSGGYKVEAISADATNMDGLSSGSQLALPAGTVNVKATHSSEFFNSKLNLNLRMKINSTDTVRNRMLIDYNNTKETYFSNLANYSLSQGTFAKEYNEQNTKYVYMRSYKMGNLFPETTVSKDVGDTITDDKVNARQTRTCYVFVQNFPYNTHVSDADAKYAEAAGALITDGVIYDLLPMGTYVDTSTVKLGVCEYNNKSVSEAFPKSAYDVETIDNWENSGRTMLKVTLRTPDSMKKYYRRVLQYDLTNDYSNIKDRGTDVMNTVAFVNTSDKTKVRFVAACDISKVTNGKYYKSLKDQYGSNIGFAQKSVGYEHVLVSQTGLTKNVKSDSYNTWARSGYAYLGEKYTYRVNFTAPEKETVGNIVLVDELDRYDDSEWQGKLSYVDVSSMELKKCYGKDDVTCAPVVYYATAQPSKAQLQDLSDPIWTTTKPEGTTYAIAIDCSKGSDGEPFIISNSNDLSAYIYMYAPEDESLDGKKAQNIVHSFSTDGDAPATAERDELTYTADIELRTADIELHKNSYYTEKTGGWNRGTADTPVAVANKDSQKITYSVTIENKSDVQQYNNIVMQDPIPEGLTIDFANIKMYLYKADGTTAVNNKTVNSIDGYKVTQNGQNLKFEIVKLPKGYKVDFRIPATQDKAVVKTTNYINTAKITSIDKHEENMVSETTYHRVTQQYTLTYHVVDLGEGRPANADKAPTTPDKVTGIEYDTDENLTGSTTTATTKTIGGKTITGTWTFLGWYHTADEAKAAYDKLMAGETVETPMDDINIKKNEDVYGGYIFNAETKLTVTKDCVDDNNRDGIRPTQITVSLLKNGTEVEGSEQTISLTNGKGSYTWNNLPAYSIAADGTSVAMNQYTVAEKTVTGYIATYSYGENGETYASHTDGTEMKAAITNTHEPERINVTAIKKWVDTTGDNVITKRPDSISIHLFKNGEEKALRDATIEPAEDGSWTYTFKNLYKYENGKVIDYSVTEDAVPGYTTSIDGKEITNTVTSIDIAKIGTRSTTAYLPGAHFQLIEIDGDKETVVYEWDSSADKAETIKGLKLDARYKIHETKAPAGYSLNVDSYLHISSTGVITSDIYLEKADGTILFEDQPLIDVPVAKVWDDADNQDGKRPESVTIELYADDEPTGKTVELNEQNNWKGVFTGLNDRRDYTTIPVHYTVKEVTVPEGYEVSYVPTDSYGKDDLIIEPLAVLILYRDWTVINKHEPELTTIEGQKTWNDAENQDGIRPAEITVNLLADGVEVDEVKVTAEQNWAYSFADKPVYKAGKVIEYTVTEDKVEGYEPVYTDFNIENVHTPDKVSVSVTKAWEDEDNYDKIRPGGVTIKLYADGEDTGKTLSLSGDNNWKGSFEDLDKNKAGKAIVYTISELDVPGYTAEITGDATAGYTVTNSHTVVKGENSDPDEDDTKGASSGIAKTGDIMFGLMGLMLVILLGAGYTLFRTRRKQQ